MSEFDSEFAAARRADYVRALEQEREMLERAGKKDRVKAVDAELERVGAKPVERRAPSTTTAKKTAAKKKA